MAHHLGKYQLVAEIARGGMGIVYLAVAQGPARFSKLVVVKELKPELVEDEQFLEMFLEEARLAARLSHPNIVQTYEVGEENRRHFIVMDYLDGVTLARLLRRKSPLFTRNMHLRVIAEILAGLHYAHTLKDFDGSDLGIVHRDVTPHNVFITYDATAKVVDFGIAKALDGSIETRTGVMKGKPAYMAPEQISGSVDPRADVFSAGVMLWEAVARRRMWSKKSDVEVLAAMLNGDVPSIRTEVPDVPEELAQIVERALLRNRDQRYQSAAELQAALEKFLENDPTATMREVGKVVSEIFATERESSRAQIETHLTRVKAGGLANDRLPSLPPPDGTPTSMPNSTQSLVSGLSGVSGVSSVGTPAGSAFSTQPGPPPASLAPPSKQGGRPLPWIIIGLAVILVGGGFALGLGARSKEAPLATQMLPTASVPEATPSEEPSAAPPPIAMKKEVAPTIASSAPTTPPPPERPKVAAVPQRPVWTPPPRPTPPPAPVVTTANAPETKAPDPPDESKSKTGYLTLDTYPWTRVSTGGKAIGDTPLVKVPLPVGTHVLTLENPNEKIKQTTVVTIKPGETLSRRLAF